MKRSEINAVIREASAAFARHEWVLPPKPRWDVTDFGLGHFAREGLVLINLAEQVEYCEKLMYARRDQVTPRHHHAVKKEDIICRWGRLVLEFPSAAAKLRLQVNGAWQDLAANQRLVLEAGERVTITPGIVHAFWPGSDYAVLGEVSTANDDARDNFFENAAVGRFSQIEEDEPALTRLVSDS
ncbi:MAG: D-lyxose/D-mannose family sugar isomerase [Lentisphaerae bacterium]|nr:D-lyxose/D-mannose family sugar isomerase [Lentisphaerota bacterium]